MGQFGQNYINTAVIRATKAPRRWGGPSSRMRGLPLGRASGWVGSRRRRGHNRNMTVRNDSNATSVATTRAWLAAGLSRSELARLVSTGELVRMRYGTYAKASMVAAAEADPVLAHALDVAGAIARQARAGRRHPSAATLRGGDFLRGPV